MKTSFKTALRLLALIAAGTASVAVATAVANRVEARNDGLLRAAMSAGGHDWVEVTTDGLIARLEGLAPDEAARFRALGAAGDVVNPANLRDRMEVAGPEGAVAPEFRLELLRNGSSLTLAGLIPGALGDAAALAGAAVAAIPDADLTDLLSTVPAAPPPGWGSLVETGLAALAALDTVRVEVHGGGVRVSGLALDHAAEDALRVALGPGLSERHDLVIELTAPRPVISPFLARARIDANGAVLETCAASSPEGRRRILAAARGIGVSADADCVLALGAPGPDWDVAVADAMIVLAEMGAGVLTVSDLTVTLTPGPAVAEAAKARAVGRLEAALPAGFSLSFPVPATGGGGRPDEFAFTATRSPEGVTLLRGPVGDTASRTMVETFAHARLAGGRLHMSLRSGGEVPEGWVVRVLAGLDAVADLDSGRVRIDPALISVHGRTGDPALAAQIAARLTDAVGVSAPVQVDIAYTERLDPVAALPWPEACMEEINGIQAGSKITFAPGSTDLDADARRIVRRISEILRDCGDVAIEITGHTDSQGRDEMNLSLSQARADAVVDALVGDRLLASALSAVGYGETRPVADNATAEGREANRRIEFRLRDPLQGPPAPPGRDAEAVVEAEVANGPD